MHYSFERKVYIDLKFFGFFLNIHIKESQK